MRCPHSSIDKGGEYGRLPISRCRSSGPAAPCATGPPGPKPTYRRPPQFLAMTPRMNLVRVVGRTPGLYGCHTLGLWRAGGTRRWQLAIAMAAALGVFVALIIGSSLRPRYSAAMVPMPAAWSHTTSGVRLDAPRVHSHAVAWLSRDHDRDSSPASSSTVYNTNKKPFHSMWLKQDRPSTWARLSPQTLWLPLPASFAFSRAGLASQPIAHQGSALPGGRADHDILTELCVARR